MITPLRNAVSRARDKSPFGMKAVSFAAIGVVNTAVDYAVFFLALHTVTASLVAANVMGWLVAVSCSYVMNTHMTFARESGRTLRWRDYIAFAATGVAGLVVNTGVLLVSAQVAPVWLAKVLATLAGFAVNFLMSHFFVFRPGRAERLKD